MTKKKVKELAYYLFFACMIFAKGIGLDSGDKLYYVLSAAACLCVGCKLLLTQYNIRQMAAMILLGLIAFVAYRNSGRMGILLSVLTIIGLKDMDVKKLFRLGTVIYGFSFAFTVVAAKWGLISNPLVVHEKGGIEVIRWGMGYSTGNIFHVSYFILTVLLCYTWEKRYDIKKLLVLMVGNVLVFLFSLSYTGVAVTAFYLLLNLYAVKRKRLSLAEKIIAQLPLPLCLLFSFGAPFLLKYPLVQKIDQMLQARLSFSAYYLQNQPITLFGTRMKDVPNSWVIMDNGYVYFFMTFGVVAFVLFALGYAVVIARFSGIRWKKNGSGETGMDTQQEGLPELAMIFSFLLYGIMEQFISNAFMNLSLLFMGEVLFGQGDRQGAEKAAAACEREKSQFGKIGWRYALSAGIGLVIFAGWLGLVPVKEYIEVPLTSLNYVNAQSIQIYALAEDGTKETLKKEMQQYKELLEQEQVLDAALKSAGVAERMSGEELCEALEYSLPMYIHSGETKDVFRVRILELYYDITDEEYRKLMESMIEAVQSDNAGRYTVKDDIYSEQVGKSFGTDRIEHIREKDKYVVEKSGDIVELEQVRDAVFAAVMGMLAVFAVNAMIDGKMILIGEQENESSD